MARGPARIPTALKRSLSLPSVKNIRKDEPQVPAVQYAPPPPLHLQGPAAQEWTRVASIMVEHGMLTELDLMTLAAYCDCVGTVLSCTASLRELAKKDPTTQALVVTSPGGAAYMNPLHAVKQGAIRDMVRLAAQLGLTPAGRASISVGDRGGQIPVRGATEKRSRGEELAAKYNL